MIIRIPRNYNTHVFEAQASRPQLVLDDLKHDLSKLGDKHICLKPEDLAKFPIEVKFLRIVDAQDGKQIASVHIQKHPRS